jgi:hypothetical protein
MTSNNIKKLKNMFDHKDGVSQRQAARLFNCSQKYISKTLKMKTGIRMRKKIKIPKRTDLQKSEAKTKCGRLYLKLRNKLCIMDDESYFTLNHANINGNNIFYTSNINNASSSIKFQPTAKFQKKLLVWICFSENGISKPFFLPSGLAINQKVYLEDCIKKKLIPFIEQNHQDGNYLFWPDLASSHYANSVISYLNQKSIKFVDKKDNPANLPECRPIENFWSILKGNVYKNNWQAENIDQLKRRINFCLKNINANVIQNLARSIPTRIDFVRRNGVIENN